MSDKKDTVFITVSTDSSGFTSSGCPVWETTPITKTKKPGRPPTYDFDILDDMYQYDEGDLSPMLIPVSKDDDIKNRLVKVSTALCLYKKRRGVKWDTAVRRGDGVIKVYRLT